jgi:hypothetical protein
MNNEYKTFALETTGTALAFLLESCQGKRLMQTAWQRGKQKT